MSSRERTPDREAAACQGKEQLSEIVAKKIARRNTRSDRRREAYHCIYCGFWHIGESMVPRRRRRSGK